MSHRITLSARAGFFSSAGCRRAHASAIAFRLRRAGSRPAWLRALLAFALCLAACIAAPAVARATSTSGAALAGGGLDLEHLASLDILVEGGGCQMGAAPQGGSSVLFLALGVAVALAHRRRPVPARSNSEYAGMVGRSCAMRRVFELIEQIAPTEATVLINGETGTGKELVAEAIHHRSRRSSGPFVVLDCGAIPHHLIEDQLFGHERGAFTGATFDRAGVFERGQGGTLFLDEIGELPLDAQTKLLRAIETRVVRRIGSSDTIKCDVRLVAATNRDLAAETNRGGFRSDLYYRVAVARIEVPPLRDRLEDLELLAGRFVDELTSGQQTGGLPDDFLARAKRHAWPGNVREFRNAVQRALTAPALLDIGEGPATSLWPIDTSVPFKKAKQQFVDEFDRRFMTSLLEEHGWNISAAARATGLGRMSIYKLLERLGIARSPTDAHP